jgi:DNA-binding IclR family transcriptional regulator
MSSLESAVTILGCFSPDTPELGVTDVARRLSIPKSTVSRLMKVMATRALIEQDRKTRRYRVGPLPFRLGQLYQSRGEALDRTQTEAVALAGR